MAKNEEECDCPVCSMQHGDCVDGNDFMQNMAYHIEEHLNEILGKRLPFAVILWLDVVGVQIVSNGRIESLPDTLRELANQLDREKPTTSIQ